MSTPPIATVGQKFTVAGMTCDHCRAAVTAEFRRLDGLTRVAVDLGTGTVVTESIEPLALQAVESAVAAAGYQLLTAAARAEHA